MINYNANPLDVSAITGTNFTIHSFIIENPGNQSMIDFRKTDNQWGVEGYYVPTNEWAFHKPKTFWAKGKKENIIEWEARRKKEQPAPNTYKLDYDWSKNPKGKFLKGNRVTLIDEIL